MECKKINKKDTMYLIALLELNKEELLKSSKRHKLEIKKIEKILIKLNKLYFTI